MLKYQSSILLIMSKATISLVIILMLTALTGLIGLQMYWLKQAESLNKKQFNNSVHMAMKNIADRLERRQVQDYVSKEIAIDTRVNSVDTTSSFLSGIKLKTLNPAQAKKYNLGDKNVFVVESIKPGSVAWNAGIREQDVITDFSNSNNNYLNNNAHFTNSIVTLENSVFGNRHSLHTMIQLRSKECFEEGLKLLQYDLNQQNFSDTKKMVTADDASSYKFAIDSKSGIYQAFFNDSLMQILYDCDSDRLQKAFKSKKSKIMNTQSKISSLVVKMMASNETVFEKICKLDLEEIIRDEFSKVGIKNLPEWCVLDNGRRLVANSVNYNIDKQIDYEVPIFQDNFFHGQSALSVYFNKNKASFYLVSGTSLAGFLFILTIIGCFYYTVTLLLSQKKVSELKTDFINNMTHELKTPVSTIKLATDMMLDKSVPKTESKIDRFMGIIREENNRLTHQIEKVLQIAKIEKGEEKLKIEDLYVNDLLDDILSRSIIRIENNNGELIKQLKANNDRIAADKVHVTNMLSNLLDNAIKYTPETPVIEVSTRNENGGIVVAFKDNGIGMSREVQKRIFEKFYREPTGNIHNVKGFGLGLSYVKYMIEAHGGFINVFSKKNKGSKFELFFPQAIV